MQYKYADRMAHLRASEIRELLKVTENPEIISFAGGLPAPELFPIDEMTEASKRVISEDGRCALQYGSTEGYTPLREWIADRLNRTKGTRLSADNILITNGSQQGLDLTGKVFLNEGDTVICESPTYLSAISAFRAYGCLFREVPTDGDGMLPEALERVIAAAENVKLIYMIPNFQNPSGRSWSYERRKRLMEAAERHRITVVEDDPYGELRFEGEFLPSVKSLDKNGCCVYLGTFSKILCPGFRLGWVAADSEVINKYVLVKQGTDLQSSSLLQRIIHKYLEMYDVDSHISVLRAEYKKRKDVMAEAMERYFPEGICFTRPMGGLFSWVELPENIDAKELLVRCMERQVAFVPGGAFFPNGGHENTMRVNFSNMPEERIVQGIELLAGEIRKM